MLNVKDAEVEYKDEVKRTYQLVLNFGSHMSKVRLFCKEEENNRPAVMDVAIMGGSCPCCNKPICPSLSKMGDDLLKQVCELDKFRSKTATGPALVF
jgi:hypothetical protein